MTALAVKASQRYETIQDFQAAIGLPAAATIPRRPSRTTARSRISLPPWAKKIARNPWATRAGAGTALAVLFLLSDESAYVTGTVLQVNGGSLL